MIHFFHIVHVCEVEQVDHVIGTWCLSDVGLV